MADAGTAARTEAPPLTRYAVAGLLAWLIPGLGHVYLGQRQRGLILLVTIAATFWCGVAIGGVQSTVLPYGQTAPRDQRPPRDRQAWFVAQICTGVHCLATLGLGELQTRRHGVFRADFAAEDVAIIFTGVAGLLNLLVILDAIAACDPNYVRLGSRPPPRREGS